MARRRDIFMRINVAAPALPYSPLVAEEVLDRYSRARITENGARRRAPRSERHEDVSVFWPSMQAYQSDLRKSLLVRAGEWIRDVR